MRRPRRLNPRSLSSPKPVDSRLRIIGGELRRRTILYNGDPDLRPMKDRVRESVFNLIGPQVAGSSVIDLFAGTGAMSFEALSRGARHATLVERRFPIIRVIKETAASLGVSDRATVVAGDAFRWASRYALEIAPPWLVFSCPPYSFYATRRDEMRELLHFMWQQAPPGSVLIVESDDGFDLQDLPDATQWSVHGYAPAVIALGRKSATPHPA